MAVIAIGAVMEYKLYVCSYLLICMYHIDEKVSDAAVYCNTKKYLTKF